MFDQPTGARRSMRRAPAFSQNTTLQSASSLGQFIWNGHGWCSRGELFQDRQLTRVEPHQLAAVTRVNHGVPAAAIHVRVGSPAASRTEGNSPELSGVDRLDAPMATGLHLAPLRDDLGEMVAGKQDAATGCAIADGVAVEGRGRQPALATWAIKSVVLVEGHHSLRDRLREMQRLTVRAAQMRAVGHGLKGSPAVLAVHGNLGGMRTREGPAQL